MFEISLRIHNQLEYLRHLNAINFTKTKEKRLPVYNQKYSSPGSSNGCQCGFYLIAVWRGQRTFLSAPVSQDDIRLKDLNDLNHKIDLDLSFLTIVHYSHFPSYFFLFYI